MKRLLLSAIVIMLSGFAAFAQSTPESDETIDLKKIERIAKKKKAYRALVKRFEAADSTLTTNECMTVYLGTAFQKGYTGGYGIDSNIDELFKSGNYKELYTACQERLAIAPTDLRTTRYMWYAIINTKGKEIDESKLYLHRAYCMLRAIIKSGKGTEDSPWIVITVKDEYELMDFFNVKGQKGQKLLNLNGKYCDLIEFEMCRIPDITQMYFDVSLPLNGLNKMFK